MNIICVNDDLLINIDYIKTARHIVLDNGNTLVRIYFTNTDYIDVNETVYEKILDIMSKVANTFRDIYVDDYEISE